MVTAHKTFGTEPALSARAQELYTALVERNPRYDGLVYFGVTSTGIFCRSICSARKPKIANVRYFSSATAALGAGFRPCKVCHPLAVPGQIPESFQGLIETLTGNPNHPVSDEQLRQSGLSPEAVRRWFKKTYGMTFHAFARSLRLANAFDALRCGSSVTTTAFDAGYESLSGFGDAVKKTVGKSPSKIAKEGVMWISRLETPLGPMTAAVWDEKLCLLEFFDRRALETEILDLERRLSAKSCPGRCALHGEIQRQLDAYFSRRSMTFSLPLETPGSEFQQAVWQGLSEIPYGKTRSYADQARALGNPLAVRAVARANGQNRIAIVVPCHRVIGANGSLVGYSGGLERKRRLLELEGAVRP